MNAIALTFVMSGLCVLLLAASPATQSHTVELEQAWSDLAEAEPLASAALLKLNDMPDETIALMKDKLHPLTATPDQLDGRLADLGSNDPKVWKPAFDALRYFDPRITRSLGELMDSVTDPTTRCRLVAVLCDAAPNAFDGQAITLDKNANNFRSSRGSWWAESDVARLNTAPFTTNKKQWTRAVRAIVLLKHFNSPSALSIVKDMATGNPDALPTKVAKGESVP